MNQFFVSIRVKKWKINPPAAIIAPLMYDASRPVRVLGLMGTGRYSMFLKGEEQTPWYVTGMSALAWPTDTLPC